MSAPPRLAILGTTLTALAVARDAANLGMRPVLFDTESGVAAATRRADVRLYRGAPAEALLGPLRSMAAEGPAWLVATSDRWLRFLALHRVALDRAFAEVLHPDNATLDICLGKTAFSEWCIRAGLPTPRVFDAATLVTDARRLPCPLLLRPQESMHGSATSVPKAVEVRELAELRRWIETYHAAGVKPLVTESLLGRNISQYSVGASRRGTAMMTFVAIKRRPLPESCAVGTFVELAPDDAVEALARRALDALDYRGIAEVEILRDEGARRDYLIEINARPWAQYALGPASGHDLLGVLLDPTRFRASGPRITGRRWLNLSADLYGCFSRSQGSVRMGRVPLRHWLASVARANTPAHFAWSDPGPAMRDLREFIGLLASRRR